LKLLAALAVGFLLAGLLWQPSWLWLSFAVLFGFMAMIEMEEA